MILRTERTVLRPWRPSDLPAFERLCADPRVMRYFPRTLPPEMADALARRLIDEMERNGFGAWALEIPGEADFAGFVGLGIPSFRSEWREILWRLDPAFWHRGFVTEAAEKVLETAFESLGFHEVVAFTSYWNVPSIRLMRRLGMKRDWAGDFNHPALPITHPLARHCLFRMSWRRWSSQFDDF